MEIPRDIRRNLAYFSLLGLVLLIFFMCFIFVLYAFPAKPADKIFTLTINSQQVYVILPPELPDMETARFGGEECFNLKICRQHFCIGGPPFPPVHDHVDFVFTDDDGEVMALVWTRSLERIYVAWKYVNKVPILSSIEEITNLIMDKVEPEAI